MVVRNSNATHRAVWLHLLSSQTDARIGLTVVPYSLELKQRETYYLFWTTLGVEWARDSKLVPYSGSDIDTNPSVIWVPVELTVTLKNARDYHKRGRHLTFENGFTEFVGTLRRGSPERVVMEMVWCTVSEEACYSHRCDFTQPTVDGNRADAFLQSLTSLITLLQWGSCVGLKDSSLAQLIVAHVTSRWTDKQPSRSPSVLDARLQEVEVLYPPLRDQPGAGEGEEKGAEPKRDVADSLSESDDGAVDQSSGVEGGDGESADSKGEGTSGGHEEKKRSQSGAPSAPGGGGSGKKVGFLALCMSHASAAEWTTDKSLAGRRFRDAMRLIQLESLLDIDVSTHFT